MKLAELQRALRAADPRAVLVPSRILDRIILDSYGLHGTARTVPHRKTHVVARQTLFRHAEQADLDLEPDQILPDTVILLARPAPDELSELERPRVLLKFWRRLFHASVHLALDDGGHGGVDLQPLSPAGLRGRIDLIGRTEFDEVRTVLAQDKFLPPNASDAAVYTEFAAVYLEARHFAPDLLPGMFPGLGERERERIDHMLAVDVEADALFARTRLAGAPDPAPGGDVGAERAESHAQYWELVRGAERASQKGNVVGAAILHTRAWRIAPAAVGPSTRAQALADMARLTERLAAALDLSAAEAAEWGEVLPLLLDKADQGTRPAEARLLDDLQRVCMDHERDIHTLDVVEWALSAGKRPIKRPLPGLRLVRTARHLRWANGRLGVVRLADADRERLTSMVRGALDRAEAEVRGRFGRALTTALQDVGLQPTNAPERVAVDKMVQEWLDRVISHGFLTFSDLRDTISRNQLKMPDLRDPEDFIRGDPLLRLDRRLAALLDGVYRPSEIYMRWLERLTALNFGTRAGRALTMWVTIPFAGAALLLQVLAILLHLVVGTDHGFLGGTVHRVLAGPWLQRPADGHAADAHPAWHALLWAGTGVFLVWLLHSERLRARCRHLLARGGRALYHALVEVPARLLRHEALQRFLKSWAFQLVWWYLLKPLAACAVLWLTWPQTRSSPAAAGLVLLLVALVLNSRIGEAASEAAGQATVSFGRLLRAGLLPGLYRLVLQAFKRVVDAVEFVLFTVDDWLRFRTGDTRASLVARAALGVVWFPISYLARFYTVVLIEPGFNPIKAPVSYLAAKVMLPVSVPLTRAMLGATTPWMWDWLAYAVVIPTVWLLPDVFGFLFWETKENWSLYRANRRRSIGPVSVGPHAETVRDLLQPGFHSGTVPRLYHRLRRAERDAHVARDWTAARAVRHDLERIGCAVERFVDRELLAILRESRCWAKHSVLVGRVTCAVNAIAVELTHADHPDRPVVIECELRQGWMVAGVREVGWLDALEPGPFRAFATALAALYKLAGVDLAREHVEANLPPPPAAGWDVTPDGLVVWPTDRDAPPVEYDLSGDGTGDGGAWDRLVFGRVPLYWDAWVQSWLADRDDGTHPGLNGWDRELVRRPREPATATATATA